MKRSIITIIIMTIGLTVSAATIDGISDIRAAWTGKAIRVSHGSMAAGIKEFTYAFCAAYPEFESNTDVRNYIDDPKGSEQPDVANIELDTRNGFFNYMACPTECCRYLNTCYWKRGNGHRLFAAFMKKEYEKRTADVLVVFYDYDPATDIMTPEPFTTDLIYQRMARYDTYDVRLPQEGKDITLVGWIEDEANDSATSEEIPLKWNGTDFVF